MVDPVQLRTLLEVVRLGSFAGAANRLGYTASAISQQMSALERDAGVRLFERSARSVRPTETAVVMARHAVKVLADLDRLLEVAGSVHDGVREEIRVSVYPSLARPLLPRLLRSDAWRDAGVGIRLSIADPSPTIQAMRSDEEVDIALVYRVAESGLAWPQSVTPIWLGEDRFRFVVPTQWRLHGRGAVPPEDLMSRPWIFHHPGSSDAAIIDELFRVHDLRPRTVGRSDDFAVTLDLVATGFAAAFVPEIGLAALPGEVAVLDVPEITLSRTVYALVSKSGSGHYNELFLDVLRDTLGELADSGLTRRADS